MLHDAPDYTTGRIYGPTGQATASFPVPGTYVTLADFQKWQSEAMGDNTQQNAAALAAAYSAIGVQPPPSIATASAPSPLPAPGVTPSAAPTPAAGFSFSSVPWYVYAGIGGIALLTFSARK